jgi:transcriptional regulator with XRE-family HTH domain
MYPRPSSFDRRKAFDQIAFGRKLRIMRELLGETQDKFSSRIGMERSYMSRLEHGTLCPSIGYCEKLAHAAGIPLHELISSPMPGFIMDEFTEAVWNAPLDKRQVILEILRETEAKNRSIDQS